MKGRVIVTKRCNRKCKGCCNDYLGIVDKVSFRDLFKYEEIILTGGEPMLISERVVELIHRLKFEGYQGKIWLYTANSRRLGKYWAVEMLLDEVDGITYTVHYSKKEEKLRIDLSDLRRLDQYFANNAFSREGKSDRLYIDSRIYSQEYVDSLKYKWEEVRSLEWKENGDCPLPEGEELVFYDLEDE